MDTMRWFQAMMPKEERFFDLFAAHSRTIVAGAEALRQLMDGGDRVTACCQTIMAKEHEADEIAHEVMLAVRRTFITPFDRGDIKDLITSMDDAIDQMQKTVKAVTLFEVREFEPEMREIADAIVACAGLTQQIVPLLASIHKETVRISQLCGQIIQIEGEADEIYEKGLKRLYHTHAATNPMAYITGSEIYDHLEKVVDRFDDIADEIQGIVIEQV
jgi:predicted phosphate transport protein (TIGR00153 family)